MRLSTPSMPSATAQVTSSESCSRSSLRSGRRKASWSATPSAKATGVMIRIEMNGSMPGPVKRLWLAYAPSTISAPWATLTTRMTPKARVRPLAMSAYTPPVRRPRMHAWMRRCTGEGPGAPVLALPGGLGNGRRVSRDVRRVDREQLASDPLDEAVVALRAAVGVPAEVALDGRPDARVQRLDDGRVVDGLRLRGHGLDQLPDGVGLGGAGVDREAIATELLEVRRDERRVAGRLRVGEPVSAREDAVDVARADLARELDGRVRPVREEQELRVELQLDHGLDLRVGVVRLRAGDHHVGLRGRDLRDDRREVGGLGRVDRLEDGLDAGLLELAPHAVGDRRRERVVERRVGGRLGALG